MVCSGADDLNTYQAIVTAGRARGRGGGMRRLVSELSYTARRAALHCWKVLLDFTLDGRYDRTFAVFGTVTAEYNPTPVARFEPNFLLSVRGFARFNMSWTACPPAPKNGGTIYPSIYPT